MAESSRFCIIDSGIETIRDMSPVSNDQNAGNAQGRSPGTRRTMTDANRSAQKAVIILGMHRSGTSALARVVNLLGVDLGKSFLPPDPANPSGYWEHVQMTSWCLGVLVV